MPQLSAALIDEVRIHLTERWQNDAIYQRYANAPPEYEGPPSIRSFIADMLALPATALRDQRFEGSQKLLGRPPFCQLDRSRFGELLGATVLLNGIPTTIDTLALLHVFIPSIRTVLRADICSYPAMEGPKQRARLALMESCGVPRNEFCQWVLLAPQVRALAELLWPEIRARHAARLLFSFFTTARQNGWYCNPDYALGTENGYPVRTRTVPTPLGAVTLELQRKEVERPAAVYPHAWSATLGSPNGERMAVASGMAYVPRRFCRADAFLSTADEVSDSDIMLVGALLDQFPAQFGAGLDTGIAFLCVWERNSAAPKGAGAIALQAGLKALKQSLHKVTALGVDLRPLQFNDWDLPNEPAEIATAKQEAREKLHTLLDSLCPESAFGNRAERFDMLQRHDETDSQHALFLLGASQIEWARGQNEP
jgi:hypothetical protein